jgi:surface polysaccharide O-acyltransferase-like enzyme
MTVVTAILTHWASRLKGVPNEFFYIYGGPNVVIVTVATYLTFASVPVRVWLANTSLASVVRRVASQTFGIYLAHPLFLALLDYAGFHPSVQTSLLALTVVCLGGSLRVVGRCADTRTSTEQILGLRPQAER